MILCISICIKIHFQRVTHIFNIKIHINFTLTNNRFDFHFIKKTFINPNSIRHKIIFTHLKKTPQKIEDRKKIASTTSRLIKLEKDGHGRLSRCLVVKFAESDGQPSGNPLATPGSPDKGFRPVIGKRRARVYRNILYVRAKWGVGRGGRRLSRRFSINKRFFFSFGL